MRNAVKVKANGEEAILHITDQSVMFEKGGKVSGFERSAIRMVKPDGDAMIIAYSAGSEVKSVRVEPMTAVASLLMSSSPSDARSNGSQVPTSTKVLNEVFERLYRDTRKELEERLAKVQEEPENKSLRLTPHEEEKCNQVYRQMRSIVGSKYGFDPDEPNYSLGFFGLEKEPYDRQLDTVKTLHVWFLSEIVGPKAETADITYSAFEVWPEDWERIIIRFKLADRPFLAAKFKSYLRSKWTHHEGNGKPALARL